MSLPAVAESVDESHRARKLAAAKARIAETAVALALENGYEGTTIEMICEASMISQRTFFNYFGTKEQAVLGPIPKVPDPEQLDGFVHAAGTNVLGDLVETFASLIAGYEPDLKLFRDRRLVIQRTPELKGAEMARMVDAQDKLVTLVLARFRAQGRRRSPELEDEARMVVSLATGVIHYVMQSWRRSRFTRRPDELLREATALVARVTSGDAGPTT